MARIDVNSEWRIESDERCWMVCQRNGTYGTGKRVGEERWDAVSYHQTPVQAAESLAQRRLRLADVEGIQAVMDEWGRITREIDAALARA